MKRGFELAKRIEVLETTQNHGVLIFKIIDKVKNIPKNEKFTGSGYYTENKKGIRKHYIEGQLVPDEILNNVVIIYDSIQRPKSLKNRNY